MRKINLIWFRHKPKDNHQEPVMSSDLVYVIILRLSSGTSQIIRSGKCRHIKAVLITQALIRQVLFLAQTHSNTQTVLLTTHH